MNPMNSDMNGSWCPSTHPHHQHKLYEALKINKESRIIKKPSSTTSSPTSSTSLSHEFRASTNTNSSPPKPQQRHPLIIYTQSPKIIHTNLKDFKELVKKLTGMSHSEDDQKSDPHGIKHETKKGQIRCKMVDVSGANQDENESFKDISTSEDICGNVEGNAPENSNFIGNMDVTHHSGANNYNELQCYSSEPAYHFVDFNIPFN